MEFNYYDTKEPLNEVRIVTIIRKVLKQIKKFGDVKLRELLKESFDQFMDFLEEHKLDKKFLRIMNKQFNTAYSSLDQLKRLKFTSPTKEVKEGVEIINEDWKNFLKFWKGETYPALSIFPTLQIWFQLDKLIDGAGISELDWRKIGIYAVLWIIILTGQHALLWAKWKKENPDDYAEEGSPGIFISGIRTSAESEDELTRKWLEKKARRQAD